MKGIPGSNYKLIGITAADEGDRYAAVAAQQLEVLVVDTGIIE